MTSLHYYNKINALLLRIAVDIGCYDNHDVESHLHIPIEVLGFESCVHTNCMLCLHKHT